MEIDHRLDVARLHSRFADWRFREHFDTYIAWMLDAGFSAVSIRRVSRMVGAFARWLIDEHDDGLLVDEAVINRFLAWRALRHPYCNGSAIALTRLLAILRDTGAVPTPPPSSDARQLLIESYRAFLKQQGFAPRSVASYVWFAGPFVTELWVSNEDGLSCLTTADVIGYIERQAPLRSAATAKIMCARLRSFLRYLRMQGIVDADLAASVPAIRSWTLTGLPTYLTVEQLDRVLDHCDRTTIAGCRDYAVLLLLARLGLRANEVATLRLDDIDWRSGVLQVQGKGGRRVAMPLPPDVGSAIVDYLRHARPVCAHRQVFLRVETPCTPFTSQAPVSLLAKRALRRAGVTGIAHHHAHVFRHTLATSMIRTGAALTEIAQVLRHQDAESTRIYAKVDLPSLRRLSQPWPGGDR